MPIVCQNCGARPFKIHYTEIINNKMMSVDLCLECAKQKGISVEGGSGHGLGDLVAGLIDDAVQAPSEKVVCVQCPSCGFEYSEFKNAGRFGCSECYTAFETQLIPLLRQIHGSTQHQGKSPEASDERVSRRRELTALKEQLATAIHQEAYEEAARIRDRIKSLETRVQEP